MLPTHPRTHVSVRIFFFRRPVQHTPLHTTRPRHQAPAPASCEYRKCAFCWKVSDNAHLRCVTCDAHVLCGVHMHLQLQLYLLLENNDPLFLFLFVLFVLFVTAFFHFHVPRSPSLSFYAVSRRTRSCSFFLFAYNNCSCAIVADCSVVYVD